VHVFVFVQVYCFIIHKWINE